MWQVVPKLEGVDELLNMPLDEECLQRLLSGDGLDDDSPTVRAVSILQLFNIFSPSTTAFLGWNERV